MTGYEYISLGITASHRRNIKSGEQYNSLFPPPQGTDPLLSSGASVYDTLDFMAEIVGKTRRDTVKISDRLKNKSLAQSCRNIWDFLYNHIQYKKDKDGEEQLRRPARSWADRVSGIDCDCFAIFASSILSNMGITHALRICEINRKGYFQHVYVVVPVDQNASDISGQYITIDPVLDRFNLEAPGVSKTHDKMIPVRYLNGLDEESVTGLLGHEFSGFEGLGCAACSSPGQVADQFARACANHLRNTQRVCNSNPEKIGALYDLAGLNQAIDYALQYADDPVAFGEALAHVAYMDDQILVSGLEGIEAELFGVDYVLGAAKTGKKPGFLTKAAAAVKTVTKAAAQNVSKGKVAEVAKKAGQAVVKFNPVSTAARAGFLLAMEINMFDIADQIRWGYATPDQLKKYGVSEAEAAKAREALKKVEHMFVDTLKGQKDNLKKAILSGKQRLEGFAGFEGLLGEPVTAGVSTTAAMTFILKAKDWIKGLKIIPKVKDFAAKNPNLVSTVKDKAIDKVFAAKRKPTEVNKDGAVQESDETGNQGPAPVIPAEPDLINPPAAKPMMPVSPAELPALDPAPIVKDQSSQDATTDQPKKSKSGMIWALLGIGTVAAIAVASRGSAKKSKPMNGPGKPRKKSGSKAKAKKAKASGSKAKKTYTIKIS